MGKREQKSMHNFQKIISVLKQHQGGLWIREIARQTGLHMETVRRIIEQRPAVFENYADFTQYRINLRIIKLRKNAL